MSNTFSQIYIHIVIVVKFRASLIDRSWKESLYKYITAIVQHEGHKLIAINGVADHVHILIGLKPHTSVSKIMQDVKSSSSKWINDHHLTRHLFRWQSGYGAFSCSKRELSSVIRYIENQETHHQANSLRNEFMGLLVEYDIKYSREYLFDFLD